MAQTSGHPAVAGLLLAAGGGRRLGGRPKALLEHRNRPLIEHAVRVLRNGGCGPLHVVLGAAAVAVFLVVLLGVLPVVWRATTDLGSELREGRGAGAAPVRRRMRAGLVVAEFAIALVLLVG